MPSWVMATYLLTAAGFLAAMALVNVVGCTLRDLPDEMDGVGH